MRKTVIVAGALFSVHLYLLMDLLASGEYNDGEIYLVYYLKISILSFPLGLLSGIFVTGGLELLKFVFNEPQIIVIDAVGEVILVWFGLLAASIFQWCFAVPWVVRRLSKKRAE